MSTALRVAGWIVVYFVAVLCILRGLRVSGFWHKDGHQGGPSL